MTRSELNTSIDAVFDNNRADNSLTPLMEGTELKKVADYAEQLSGKTSGQVVLSGVQQVLPYDINICSSAFGEAFLPTTTIIGKEVVVMSLSQITIWSNANHDPKIYPTSGGTTISNGQRYRFTYIGLGTGINGSVSGFWLSETF